jgi:hypothetical protein
VLKFRSVKSIVIAPANTGTANKRRTTVTRILQTKRGIRWKLIPGARMFRIVVIKFTAPKIEEAPAT